MTMDLWELWKIGQLLRRLRQMKEMGVNAIRITHNPASSILLDVAAKMGFTHPRKKPLIPGMEARKNMTMVAF